MCLIHAMCKPNQVYASHRWSRLWQTYWGLTAVVRQCGLPAPPWVWAVGSTNSVQAQDNMGYTTTKQRFIQAKQHSKQEGNQERQGSLTGKELLEV